MSSKKLIYHIAARSTWDASDVDYRAESLKTEGFIHCSDVEHLAQVANDLFRGRPDLVLLCIDPRRVTATIRYEPAPDRPGLFPHVYGPLEVSSVVRVVSLTAARDGTFDAALGQLALD